MIKSRPQRFCRHLIVREVGSGKRWLLLRAVCRLGVEVVVEGGLQECPVNVGDGKRYLLENYD